MVLTSGYSDPSPYKERYQGLIGVDDTVTPPMPMTGLLGWAGGTAYEKLTSASGSLNVSAVVTSSALPSGAATSANQTTGNSSLSSIDGKITACNTGAVVVSSSALPSGAATSANQTTGNSSLSSIDGKLVSGTTIGDVNLKGYNGTNWQAARIDTTTRSFQTIDYAHHEIHSGSSFVAKYYGTSKNDGQTINLYIKTPDTTKWGHMFFQWSASGAAYGRIYEAPTITANTGTNGQAILNHNRNSATTSVMSDNATTPAADKYGTDVTKTANGTIIYEEYAGAAKSQGGAGRNEDEYILKRNTAYLFEVESDAAGLTLSINMSWYEHIDQAA
jgi:hypothetical protein